MKKSFKTTIIAILTVLAVISVFPTFILANNNDKTQTEYVYTEDEFSPRLTSPKKGNPYYNRELNIYSQGGYGMPNCTAYVYGRIYEITGVAPLIKRGDAKEWWNSNKRNGYYEYGQEPRLGAIACWSNHVAVVEKIDGKMVTTSQSHWNGNYFDTSRFRTGTDRFGQKFYGYIYASDAYFNELNAKKDEEKRIEEEKKQRELQELYGSYKMEKKEYNRASQNDKVQFAFQNEFDNEVKNDILFDSRLMSQTLAQIIK